MEEYIMEIMKRTSVFLILAQAIIHFRPNPSYEKYFKFLVGIMTIVLLVIPLLELLHSDIGIRYTACMNHYTAALAEMTETELTGQTPAPAELYLEEMGEEIRAKLQGYAWERGYQITAAQLQEMTVGDLTDGAEDGGGYRVRVQMRPQNKNAAGMAAEAESSKNQAEQAVNPISGVTDITIEEIQIGEKTDKTGTRRETELEFRRAFANLLGIEEDRLEVEIHE